MPKEHRNEMVLVLVEFFKLLICLGLVIFRSSNACLELYDELWIKRREAVKMAIPVLCYEVQGVLQAYAAMSLFPAIAQSLTQLKVFAAAALSSYLLRQRFSRSDWASFLGLVVGMSFVLTPSAAPVLGQPAGSDVRGSTALGVVASIGSAFLMGYRAVFIEDKLVNHSTSIVMRVMQLSILALPFRLVGLFRSVAARPSDGLLVAFSPWMWGRVASDAAGGFITAIILKYAGNLAMIFAAGAGWISLCIISVPVFGLFGVLTPPFWLGLVLVAISYFLFEGMRPLLDGMHKTKLKWFRKFARVEDGPDDDDGDGDSTPTTRRALRKASSRDTSIGMQMETEMDTPNQSTSCRSASWSELGMGRGQVSSSMDSVRSLTTGAEPGAKAQSQAPVNDMD